MASERALALRRAAVMDRLSAAAARIAPGAAPPQWSKVPEIAGIERLEWVADLLERGNGNAGSAPADAEAALAETTIIAADLFEQVQDAQTRRPVRGAKP